MAPGDDDGRCRGQNGVRKIPTTRQHDFDILTERPPPSATATVVSVAVDLQEVVGLGDGVPNCIGLPLTPVRFMGKAST